MRKNNRFQLPFRSFTNREWFLWIISLIVVTISNFIARDFDLLILTAALVGVTSLIFATKGNVWAEILMIVFSSLYGIISFRFRYWGEMITYLGMALPMAIWATFTWAKNPSEKNGGEVKIRRLKSKQIVILIVSSIVVTVGFYYILKWFDTPNLFFSTLSILTSFAAAALTMLRSSYYAFWYALNDIVLIVLWVLASLEDPVYIGVVVNFSVFLMNDLYGFISWKRRERTQ